MGAGPQDKRSWGRRQYARPAWLWYDREMGALPGRKTVAPFPSEGEENALVVSAPGREGRDLLFLALFLEGETFALSLLLASGSERSDLLFAKSQRLGVVIILVGIVIVFRIVFVVLRIFRGGLGCIFGGRFDLVGGFFSFLVFVGDGVSVEHGVGAIDHSVVALLR